MISDHLFYFLDLTFKTLKIAQKWKWIVNAYVSLGQHLFCITSLFASHVKALAQNSAKIFVSSCYLTKAWLLFGINSHCWKITFYALHVWKALAYLLFTTLTLLLSVTYIFTFNDSIGLPVYNICVFYEAPLCWWLLFDIISYYETTLFSHSVYWHRRSNFSVFSPLFIFIRLQVIGCRILSPFSISFFL